MTGIPFFIPRVTVLHKFHPVLKIVTLFFYGILILSNPNPFILNCTLLLLLILFPLFRFPLQIGTVVLAILLESVIFLVGYSHANNLWGQFSIAAGKMLAISFLITLFTLTTHPNEIFNLLRPSSYYFRMVQPVIYILLTILAVFPSIEYDLSRAIDAESLRLGKRIMFYHFSSWLSVLTVVVVRALNRAERFTDTVIDRGYTPAQGLILLESRRIRMIDFLVLLAFIVPGLFLMVVLK
jgi:energy-coupling factor transporter transmembrane protein EcfT